MKKNKRLTIIVASLLVVIGVSFSYFIATTLINGKGSSVVGTTARIKGAEINVEGTLEFNDTDVYPGHKNVSAIKVTATGNNQLIPYHLVWKGESGISQINYTVYKSSTPKTLSTNCERKTEVQNGLQVLSEECTISNLDTLGEAIASGFISKGDTREILAQDEFITATSSGTSMYYYVVLEYPNLNEDQSSDANATFKGEVTVEESNKQADINILAVYVADDSGNYTETADIPKSGYVLSEKSTCSNNSQPIWDSVNRGVTVSNLTKSGTSCYLYFNKLKIVNTLLGNIGVNSEAKTKFDKVAVADEGIQQASDGMYGGISYYWRGASTTNFLKFAGYCWRIIRINGDGSIHLIYDGESCHVNGASTAESIAVASQAYNTSSDRSEYVGYTYTVGSQRGTTEKSNLKTQTEDWYKTNIADKGYDGKVATGKFCNDRNIVENSIWDSNPSYTFNYSGHTRLISNNPTFNCLDSDIYILKVGAITADEVMYAGGTTNIGNTNFYLYNGQDVWMMTPNDWYIGGWTSVFSLDISGTIRPYPVFSSFSIRPVINLRSDITISSGDGTLNNPYIVDL